MKTLAAAIAAVNRTYKPPTALRDKLREAILLHADKDGFLTDTRPESVLESVWEVITDAVKEFVDKNDASHVSNIGQGHCQ